MSIPLRPMSRALRLASLILCGLLATPAAFAAAGMWPLNNLPVKTLKQQFGFTPTPAWIRHVQLASVRLAEGCSGSFVSPHGLVLTNHHCVVGCLQDLSSPQRNLMAQAFYAADVNKEPRCPGMEIQQLIRMTNITRDIRDATQGKTGAAFNRAEKAESTRLQENCVHGKPKRWLCEVVTLYHGGQYWIYKYRRYDDVRLVMAPRQQTAYFGGNIDNFDYPRYDWDVSFVRVFADGRPATTPEYFRISSTGPKAGELVFTSGNPGSTRRGWTLAQLAAERYPLLPDALMYLSQYRGVLEAYSAEGPEQARIAQGTLFFVDNSIKALHGMWVALHDRTAFARKQAAEHRLREQVETNPALRAKYGDAWREIATAEKQLLTMAAPYSLILRRSGFRGHLFETAFTLVLGAHERTLPNAARIAAFRKANLAVVEQQVLSKAPYHPGFNRMQLRFSLTRLFDTLGPEAPISRRIFDHADPAQVATTAVNGSRLADLAVRKALWKGGERAIRASTDPMIRLAREVLPFYLAIRKRYDDAVKAPMQINAGKIARARFALYGTSIPPDATFTERLSFGRVEGWMRNGQPVPPFTHIRGLYRHATGYPPFAISEPWLRARKALNPNTPMNLVSSNDIVGGNSGSPLINRKAELVGLIFDGNPPSLGGTFWYDGRVNRAVSVDSAVLLEGLEKVYHATRLVRELTGK